MIQDMEREGAHDEAGLEEPVKDFAVTISYVAFVFKFFVFFVLWKVSYNYLLDVKGI